MFDSVFDVGMESDAVQMRCTRTSRLPRDSVDQIQNNITEASGSRIFVLLSRLCRKGSFQVPPNHVKQINVNIHLVGTVCKSTKGKSVLQCFACCLGTLIELVLHRRRMLSFPNPLPAWSLGIPGSRICLGAEEALCIAAVVNTLTCFGWAARQELEAVPITVSTHLVTKQSPLCDSWYTHHG